MNNETRSLATKALDDDAAIRDRARREMFELLTVEPEPRESSSMSGAVELKEKSSSRDIGASGADLGSVVGYSRSPTEPTLLSVRSMA